jgi:hypothetical protein
MKINYFKEKQFPWKNTIFIVGLPRSGKSTIYNILSSCNNTESLEEPFSILSIAQKASLYEVGSKAYIDFMDLYLSNAAVLFNELSMGRIYNFRKIDKSYIYNYKTHRRVEFSHSLKRQIDVVEYTNRTDLNFILAMNDIERCLDFLVNPMPNPFIVKTKRNIIDIAYEISEKGWLSDESLISNINITPAFCEKVRYKSKDIFIPYLISSDDIKLFLSLSLLERSFMFSFLQDKFLKSSIEKINKNVIEIDFEDIAKKPKKTLNELISSIGLQPTKITKKNLKELEEAEIFYSERKMSDMGFSSKLIDFIKQRSDI